MAFLTPQPPAQWTQPSLCMPTANPSAAWTCLWCWQVAAHVALAECPPDAGPPHCQDLTGGEWYVDYFSPWLQAACGCVHHHVGEEIPFFPEANHSSVKWGTKHRWVNYFNSSISHQLHVHILMNLYKAPHKHSVDSVLRDLWILQ